MSRIHRRKRLQSRKLVLESLECRKVLAVYYVDGDFLGTFHDGTESHPFTTIREGIEAALAAPEDDEVVIAPKSAGPYNEPIAIVRGYSKEQVRGFDQFNGGLVIRGATGRAADVVLESDVGSNIYIDAPIDVKIQSLTVGSGGIHGILNRSHNDVVLDNLIIKDHLHQGPNGPYGWSGIIHQGGNLSVRNSEIFNNWQGIWVGRDDSVSPATAPGQLTVENTHSHDNRFNGIYATALTSGLTTVNFSGFHNGNAGVQVDNFGTVSISAGSFSENAGRGISLTNIGSAAIRDVQADENGASGLVATSVSSLSISGGSFSDNFYKGINIWSANGVTIDRVLVEGNGSPEAQDDTGGAGIRVQPATSAPIVISNSTIRKNETLRYGAGFEMWNPGNPAAPTITFVNTEVADNKTANDGQQTGRGGGISVVGNGNLEILDSKILRNEAGVGGGVYHSSPAGSTYYLRIDGSTIDGNTSYFNGGLERFQGRTTIANSTFSQNTSSNGAGGLRVANSSGSMTNVTVSENKSTGWVGGMTQLSGYGFSIVNSTIVNNTGLKAGGLYYPNGANLTNNVIAMNTSTAVTFSSPDVNGSGQSHGGNFIGDPTGSSGFNSQIDFVGTRSNPLDPQLGELQDNGGKTLTHLPLPGSPLIDQGVTSAGRVDAPRTDQRGVARPQYAGYDIGSVEVDNTPPVLAVAASSVSVDEGQSAQNSGTFFDRNGDAVTLSASVGTVTTSPDGTWQWSLTTGDGPDQDATVTITADDGAEGVSTVTFQLAVSNVAPTLQLGATSPIQSGQDTTLTLSATDPSQADTDAGFTYQIDWDSDGTFDETVSGGMASASHSFTALGVHTITAQAVDKDGGASQLVTTQIAVVPAPLAIAGDDSVNLNSIKNGKKTFGVVVPSTATFDARELSVASVVWAGAHVYKSSYLDMDSDGDIDAVFEFLLSKSNAVDLYRQALATDPSHNHQTVTTELTAVGSDGTIFLGAAQVDFFMNGKALEDLLDSI